MGKWAGAGHQFVVSAVAFASGHHWTLLLLVFVLLLSSVGLLPVGRVVWLVLKVAYWGLLQVLTGVSPVGTTC